MDAGHLPLEQFVGVHLAGLNVQPDLAGMGKECPHLDFRRRRRCLFPGGKLQLDGRRQRQSGIGHFLRRAGGKSQPKQR